MKGIILAGGTGSRLYPLTKSVSKQLLPVYDKPMIYYPLSTLMLAGIREILIISTPQDLPSFERLLGDGSAYGIELTYAEQPRPEGLAQAFIIGREFIGSDDVCMVLGDNLFHGASFAAQLAAARDNVTQRRLATIFGYPVSDPTRYGVVCLDANGKPIDIEEKPKHPKSNLAVVGLYFYPNDVVQVAQSITPSERGELEITAVNDYYLQQQQLSVISLGRGFAWLDTGTHEALMEATNYVSVIQKRQGLVIACLEEIALRQGWITMEQLQEAADQQRGSTYGQYLASIKA
ncbi:MAG: glucose-1-phosphate thymidylyltransferase RfbA [Porphyromonas sp.]|uniref:glucose-1-phosphate thymidylyltransferase RfbA n=1 Tax=Porphyromonas sp. TaxID=1924944 RepID=UPI0025CC3B60|nr:glucose-1-phosphate thymidylyltransferase RfbA [Porphyromonas sp.]MDD6928993.1 glucose-1-phosphate thymidylyltransferase RfbA [Bacteroidales bacterium]MDY3111424.1 glucose-1-phosphate thymidylyltransferase RfbA [Porphyromonas sp.]MDY4246390.1 glucose-1-phosphate thymidylyltransferase RfbA [Porphyromonas sp.]